jgi:uncharacterized protein (TIGR03067 family)
VFALGCGGPSKPDLDLMQGRWRMTYLADHGAVVSEKEAQRGSVEVKGNKFAMKENETAHAEVMTFQLDPAQNPKQITFTTAGKDSLGIYEFKGDEWSVAIANPGEPRPKYLDASSKVLLLTLQRSTAPASTTPPASPTGDKSADKPDDRKPSP